ncbi:hypothetical protein [Eremococcus coleocola]|uniref:hypothetical protein n=1 Tax=Eremococcus coleocola TaxID=88132 RepID=UPI00041456E4|nr:hypothetical protein [Eremococcus coleocola]
MKIYNDLKELMCDNEELAEELLNEFDNNGWVENQLYLYETVEDFAEYELTEGWYTNIGLGMNHDYRGAPNPLDYIDLTALGEALVKSWDVSSHYINKKKVIVRSDYGW